MDADLAVTVKNPEMVLTTAVFEYYQAQIAVAGADFAGFDCHQAMKMIQSCSVHESFLLSLLSIKKNHLLKWQYEKQILGYVLSFHVALAVEIPKSKKQTVGQSHDRQFEREKSCLLLPA